MRDLQGPEGFGDDHLPYGVFSPPGGGPRVGVRHHDRVVDLAAATGAPALATGTLDALLALGPAGWAQVREQAALAVADAGAPAYDVATVAMHAPFTVGDYVDFYASEHHARNAAAVLRPEAPALPPAWRHLPIGYHGRAQTVVPSGTPVLRPVGQGRPPADGDGTPAFGPSRRLDLEAELGYVVGAGSVLGERVTVDAFAEHVFGVVGLNDWSARDLQGWEMAPLGPFLGKSFATSVSLWVTPLAALAAAWTDLPGQDPVPLPYLRAADGSTPRGLDVSVEVEVDGEVLSRPPYASTYWAPAQMLAHLTVNGASVRPGDLFASGTISGPGDDQLGSLLEMSAHGRGYLEDGQEVVLRYTAPTPHGGRLSLGEVRGRVLPARP